jgi:acetyltransferase-like isoleucine patch superfamily enzyme
VNEEQAFRSRFLDLIDNQDNRFHPLVWINGDPEIGEGTYIGGMSEVNAKGARVLIGKDCDIASFVAINVADSHRVAIGLDDKSEVRDIVLEDRVFVGSHCAILGGSHIGHNSVIAAGTIVRGEKIPPYSLVIGNPAVVKARYYEGELKNKDGLKPI